MVGMAAVTTATANGFNRSPAQRDEALLRANHVRTWRAELKKDLKAGRKTLPAVLLAPEEELLTMKVFDLMLAAPKFGRVKVNKILTRERVSPSKTVGGLSSRQRAQLVAALGVRR
jgi:hypothetical protein